MDAFIQADDIYYTYPDGTKALQGLSLEAGRGEKLAILGANGCGKSTLFLCLNGVLKISGGSIYIGSQKMEYSKKALSQSRKAVGIVFQDPDTQLFCVNVWQETAFGPYNLGLRGEELASRVDGALEMCDLASLSAKPPHFLSGGQKKRASIAAVLSMQPEAVIFDEPMGSLDPFHAKEAENIITGLSNSGITVILSTHDVDMAYRWADRCVAIKDGKAIASAPPAEFFSDEGMLRETGLKKPAALSVWQALASKGLFSDSEGAPKTPDELAERIFEARGEIWLK